MNNSISLSVGIAWLILGVWGAYNTHDIDTLMGIRDYICYKVILCTGIILIAIGTKE
jgi:hypothetical protein